MRRMLIVCYSWSNGNTWRVAQTLARATGADLVRLETAVPYPKDYNETVEQGQREVEAGYQPDLLPLEVRPEDYDVIAVGTPTWWYTMAPAVRTFLAGHDWTGKTVIPFMTNGGWPGHVLRDMEALCPGARVCHGLEVRFDSNGGSQMKTAQSTVDAWAAQTAREIQ